MADSVEELYHERAAAKMILGQIIEINSVDPEPLSEWARQLKSEAANHNKKKLIFQNRGKLFYVTGPYRIVNFLFYLSD